MHAKIKVNFFVMQITHVSEPNGAQSKKQKLKLRQNSLAGKCGSFELLLADLGKARGCSTNTSVTH